jgi:hypothetical protein
MTFIVPEYTCKHPIFPHYNNVDVMYDALNNGCEQKDWYAYLDFISDNQFDFGGG